MKFDSGSMVLFLASTINRTKLELKLAKGLSSEGYKTAINRTKLELKYSSEYQKEVYHCSINRTKLELK